MEEFNVRLKKALMLRDMSQTKLCELTNIPKSAISQYISGGFKPKQTRTYILAEALKVNPAWLMGYDIPIEQDCEQADKNTDYTELKTNIIDRINQLNFVGLQKANEYIQYLLEQAIYTNNNLSDDTINELK